MKGLFLIVTSLVILVFSQCKKQVLPLYDEALPGLSAKSSSWMRTDSREKIAGGSIPRSILPADFKETIAKIVAPAREALLQVMERDETGTYSAFKEDVEKLRELKSDHEKQEHLYHIKNYYYGFVSRAWEKAAIDEAYYMKAIIRALPDSLRERVVFDAEFLNFTIEYSSRKDPLPSEKPEPPPAPAPELQCYNATKAILRGSDQEITLAAAAMADVFRYIGQPSSYYYLFANGAAFPLYGIGRGTSWVTNGVTIPGTFMADDKWIRIRKNLTWDIRVTAFAGGLVSSANGMYWSVTAQKRIEAWAPVIWFSEVKRNEAIFEEQLVDKSQLSIIRGGFAISDFAFTEGLGYANSTGTLTINNWTLCEELKK